MGSDLTRGISAIVLAAGANERLKTIVPPFMKPLILMNGRPLIQHAVGHALSDWDVKQVVIVAGPDNAKQLVDVLPGRVNYNWVLQPRPMGVIDALMRAVQTVTSDRVVILCADNTFASDIQMPRLEDTGSYIAVRRDIKAVDAVRFTRLSYNADGTVCEDTNGSACWVGPLYTYTTRLLNVLKSVPHGARELVSELGFFYPLEMRCEDLGIPEEHA